MRDRKDWKILRTQDDRRVQKRTAWMEYVRRMIEKRISKQRSKGWNKRGKIARRNNQERTEEKNIASIV